MWGLVTLMRKGVCIPVVLILLLFLLSSLQILLEDVAVEAQGIGGDPDATLYVDGTYKVTGHEVWRDVTVRSGARLLVMNGAVLETRSIHLEGSSSLEVRRATLAISDRSYASEVGIFGECNRFDLLGGSRVTISGTDGVYDVPHSRGGKARIDVVVYISARVKGSTVEITGGNGLSPGYPMTVGDLGGDAFAGGDAEMSINVTAYDPVLEIKSSSIRVKGGDGGKAPDGQPPMAPETAGRGGGYTRGGDVSGTVGSGGDAELVLRARSLTVMDTLVELVGGKAGDAGDGGDIDPSQNFYGSGGGGYSGGDGGTRYHPSNAAGNGGNVSGEVGTGGDATALVRGMVATISRTTIDVTGGKGGDAGDGATSASNAGGGGGGYTGGGGGTISSPGGDGGNVHGDVGSGGDALINITLWSSVLLNASYLSSTGGAGGSAGDGGDALGPAGGGGGGYSGGGGGRQGTAGTDGSGSDGGDGGDVKRNLGAGGDATVVLVSYYALVFDCNLSAFAGHGGDQGDAGEGKEGTDDGPKGGGGGAGYSGGGGAGTETTGTAYGNPGSSGDLVGHIGDGGDASVICYSPLPTITRSSSLFAHPGEPGSDGVEPPYDPLCGDSAHRSGQYGSTVLHIPMSRPLITWPQHGTLTYSLPVCRWVDVHDSTLHGPISAYLVEVDDYPTFDRVEFSITTTDPWAEVTGLSFGSYYVRVRAIYSEPPGHLGPESIINNFGFDNAPPTFHMFEPLYINEMTETVVDLAPFITDVDTELENLTMTTGDPAVRNIENLTMTLYFDEPSDIRWVKFSLSDGYTSKLFKLPVVVWDVNEPPEVVSIGGLPPPVTLQVDEGTVRWFEIELLDPDGDDMTMSLYSSWRGIRLFSNGSIRVTTRQERFGQFHARLEVEDKRRAITVAEITILVNNVCDPPGPIEVYSPWNRSVHKELDSIPFTVKVNDPDLVWGEELWVTWTSNVTGQLMSIKTTDIASFHINDLPVGHHRITITVWDGTYKKETYLDIRVKEREIEHEPEERVAEEIPPYIIVLLIAMPLLGYYLGRKGVDHAD